MYQSKGRLLAACAMGLSAGRATAGENAPASDCRPIEEVISIINSRSDLRVQPGTSSMLCLSANFAFAGQ